MTEASEVTTVEDLIDCRTQGSKAAIACGPSWGRLLDMVKPLLSTQLVADAMMFVDYVRLVSNLGQTWLVDERCRLLLISMSSEHTSRNTAVVKV